MKKLSLVLGFCVLSSAVFAQRHSIPKVVYGDDNRLDVYAVKDSALVELSRSTAAMIDSAQLKGGGWNSGSGKVVTGKTLLQRGMCASERFSNQVSAANCSGFLISDRILVTAGHCVETNEDCTKYKWVFDYKMENEGTKKITIDNSNIFSCKKVIDQVLDPQSDMDFAVIELDRPVTNRRPLSFRKSGKITPGTPLVVMGHPSGLPLKIADGAAVRSVNDVFLVANLDTYGGNSGSAVFNAVTHEVEGILVRGENDYISNGSCKVTNRVSSDAGRGEDVTLITNVKAIKKY